jgi:hypothetical protein
VVEFFSTAQGRFAVQDTGPRAGRPVVLVAGLGDDHAGHMTFWEALEAWSRSMRRWLDTRP